MRAGRVARGLVWPVVMVVSIVVAIAGFRAGWSVGVWSIGVSALNVIAILALERALPRVPGVSMFGDRQTKNDVAHGILVAGLARTLAGPLAAAAIAATFYALPGRGGAAGWPTSWPIAAQVVLGLVVYSFGSYWTHRWCHTTALGWRFHALHHDTTEMHVLKGNRIHLGEDVLRQFGILLPLYLLGVPGEVLLWIGLWNNFEGALGHANIDFAFPHWAHYVVPTPALHLVHHGRPIELQKANYHGITPIWDLVFGTFAHPDDHLDGLELGIDDDLGDTFWDQLRSPFARPQPAVVPALADADADPRA